MEVKDSFGVQLMRLFVGEPVWTAHNRPQEDHPARQEYINSLLTEQVRQPLEAHWGIVSIIITYNCAVVAFGKLGNIYDHSSLYQVIKCMDGLLWSSCLAS